MEKRLPGPSKLRLQRRINRLDSESVELREKELGAQGMPEASLGVNKDFQRKGHMEGPGTEQLNWEASFCRVSVSPQEIQGMTRREQEGPEWGFLGGSGGGVPQGGE